MKVEFAYLEIVNATEQLMVFSTEYYGKPYGLEIILNTALPIEVQDGQIRKVIEKLATMKKADVE